MRRLLPEGSTIKGRCRQATGSVLILVLLVLLVIGLFVVPPSLVLSELAVCLIDRKPARNVVEAAGLVAADDLSRMAIDDPAFGYVSLSNHPPTGNATHAPDGKPLQVIAINTLVGTIRQNSLVARPLGKRTMALLAGGDATALKGAMTRLEAALSRALGGTGSASPAGADGDPVDLAADVRAYLIDHLPANVELESVSLSLGRLSGGSDTAVPIPQPEPLALIQPEDCQADDYRAFTDIPVGRQAFTFAGPGRTG